MKTSPSQFEMLVTYMEQHGDLSKLSTSSGRGRITNLRHWEELTNLLNGDGTGATKTTEKWKKVWSDFKNNTKKKAARLHRAATGTGGGPAVFAKLVDLEQRVLNLLGVQVATGLAVEEAGLSQQIENVQPYNEEEEIQTLHEYEETSENVVLQSPPSQLRAISSPPLMFAVQDSQPNCDEPGPSRSTIVPASSPPPAATHLPFVEVQVEESGLLSPTRPSVHTQYVQDTPRSARRHRGSPRPTRRHQESPRRRVRPTHTEQATQQFVQSDTFWREFKERQHQDLINSRRERDRIRVLEIQTQKEWQAVGHRALNLLEKVVEKYCKE